MGVYDDDYGTPDEQAANKRKIANLLRAEADDDGNEFEGLTPRELRNTIRALQEDLKRAVEDRGKLRYAVQRVNRATALALCHTEPTVLLSIITSIANGTAEVLAEVEGA